MQKNDAASAAPVGFDLHFHALAKATLTGLYGRCAFAVSGRPRGSASGC
jgi:hypothetical protein